MSGIATQIKRQGNHGKHSRIDLPRLLDGGESDRPLLPVCALPELTDDAALTNPQQRFATIGHFAIGAARAPVVSTHRFVILEEP